MEHPRTTETYKTSSSKPVQLCPSPKTIRKSMIFWKLQGVQKSNNPFKCTHGWILFNALRLNNYPCFLKKEKNCITMKTRSTVFLAIAIMITLLTNRISTKNSLLWQEILMMFLSVPQTLKLLANIFPSHRYIYLVTCRLQCTWTPYYKIEREKQYNRKNCVLFLRK